MANAVAHSLTLTDMLYMMQSASSVHNSVAWHRAVAMLYMGIRRPPWTFVNLLLYTFGAFAEPRMILCRATYASMWGTAVSFEAIGLLDRTAHVQLMDKQGFSPRVFYTFDILVHWLPLILLHVPFQGFAVNSIGACVNLLWGVAISGGTMNLSDVYCYIKMQHWWCLWVLCLSVTTFVTV